MFKRTKSRFTPPWESGEMSNPGEVRERYASGFWDYALGRDPQEHGQYENAVKLAEEQGWNPWWIRKHGDVDAVLNGCYFDLEWGEYICNFFEKFLKLSKGKWAGKPFELIDWQRYDLLMPLNGWRRDDGLRRFRECLLPIAKKNGKSATVSGLCLFFLVADGEEGPEVYSAAGDREQAAIISSESEKMVKKSPPLNARLTCVPSRKTIAYPEKNGKLVALSADAKLKEGLNWNFVGFDELHVQRDRVMWDTLRYGGASREQPMLFAITTAGVYDQTSLCWTQWEIADRVLEGTIEDQSFFALKYAADPEDDWKDEDTWWKANPSVGVTINVDDLQAFCDKAIESPTEQNSFKRYRLNQWVRQVTRWMDQDKWNACGGNVSLDDMAGRTCFAGVDLSSTTDLSALGLWFPATEPDEKPKALVYFWLPEDNIQTLEDADHVPYTSWIERGYVYATAGNVIDYQAIRKKINDLSDIIEIQSTAFDAWNATSIITDLQNDGFNLVKHGQSYGAMSGPVKELEKDVLSGNLIHSNNPALNWHISNAQAASDPNGNVKIIKGDGKTRFKVDGVIALVMARSLASKENIEETESIYETGGDGSGAHIVVVEY